MGPTLILDKSALQALSQKEVWRLRTHFSLNIPPILISEILGDLAKEKDHDQVIFLARKLPAIEQYENEHYRTLCLGSLSGLRFDMRGVPVIAGGMPVTTKSGERGVFFDATPEQIALLRWGSGDFSDSERLEAETWRGMIPKIDVDSYADRLSRYYIVVPRAEDFRELAVSVDHLLRDGSLQEPLLNCLLDECGVPDLFRTLALFTWTLAGRPPLRKYAPYAFHCMRVLTTFIGGIRNDLITNRASNRLDLEYCYYLPFCVGFVSRDLLHKGLSEALLNEDQDFIDADELKADLRRLDEEWEQMSDEQRRERKARFGDYPPDRPDSIVARLWKKHMPPWRPGMGDRSIELTKEQEAGLLAKIDEMMEAVESAKSKKSG